MYKPFDQLHKALLAAFLGRLGRVDSEREVPSQLQYIDTEFEPDERAAHGATLGWLGRMAAAGTCLIECFSEPPGIEEVGACVRKQLVVHQERQLAARRGKHGRTPMPRLWIVTAGRPEAALHAYHAQPMSDWPAGFWHTRPAARMHVVIVRELPELPETLLLRLLGRGPTLDQALRELERLAPDTLERRPALPLVLAFSKAISQNDLEDHDMQPLQKLMAVYADIISEAQETGLERGIRKGHARGRKEGRATGRKEGRATGRKEGLVEGERAILSRLLTRRFGPLPAAATARIQRADLATIERWSDRLLTATSLDDVLD
jgi:hypothetical protein